MRKTLLFLLILFAFVANAQQPTIVAPTAPSDAAQQTPFAKRTHTTRDASADTLIPIASTSHSHRAASDYTVEEVNEFGIIIAPAAGEERTYVRSGKALTYNSMTETYSSVDQQGTLTLVECPDGTVYMRQPLSKYGFGYAAEAWVKGYREGHKLTFPGNQPIDNNWDVTIRLCHGSVDSSALHGYSPDRNAPIVYTEGDDGYQLFLEGTDFNHIIGAFWDEEDDFSPYSGDYDTELTLASEEIIEHTVTPPANLTTTDYIFEARDYRTGEIISQWCTIGFDGNDAYLQGFCFTLPEAWIKGTRDGNRITFPMEQFIGQNAGSDTYVYGGYVTDGGAAISDIYLTYNAKNDSYASPSGLLITRGKKTSTIELAEYLSGISIHPEGSTPEPVDVRYDIPDGQLITYARNGGSYYTFFGYILDGRQEGKQIDIVYGPDGKTVYMMNPISQGATEPGSWIEGYKDNDGKIHMPLGQYTYQDPDTGIAMQTAVLRLSVSGNLLDYVYDDTYSEVTFTISPDGTLTLDTLTDAIIYEGYPSAVYGLIYNDDLTWTGYADYDTYYVPFSDTKTLIPTGLTTQTWAYMYNDGNNDIAEEVHVAIDGQHLYIAGLNAADPEAAILGTIADGTVTFPSDQYVGNSAYEKFLYFDATRYTDHESYDEEWDYHYVYRTYEYVPQLTLAYDAAAQRLSTIDPAVCILINQGRGNTDIFTPVSVGLQPSFNGFSEVAATPAAPSVIDYGIYNEDYGYDVAEFFVPTKDTEGRYIATDKLYYTIWINQNGHDRQLTFTPDLYEGLDAEITEVPYDLTVTNTSGWSSIIAGAKRIILFETDLDNIGIQTIYYGAGERHTSPIVWWTEVEEGIHTPAVTHTPVAIYTLDGRRGTSNHYGFTITRNPDGTTKKNIR